MAERRYITADTALDATCELRNRYTRHVHYTKDAAERDMLQMRADGWPGTRVWVAEIRSVEED